MRKPVPENERLSSAIDAMYRAFARYDCQQLVQSDPDCASDRIVEETNRKICGKELRELQDDELLDYYYLAVSHIGDSNDLRHFLPRIVEIILEIPRGYLEPKLLPDVLARADVREMTGLEREVLADVLRNAGGRVKDDLIAQVMEAITVS